MTWLNSNTIRISYGNDTSRKLW